MKIGKLTLEKSIGLLLFFFGLLYLISCKGLSLGTTKSPGEGLVPVIIGGLLVLFSLIIILRNRSGVTEKMDRETTARVVKITVTTVVYVLLLPWLGFKISTLAATITASRILGNNSWKSCFIFGLLTTVFAAILFQLWLKLPLPEPILQHIGL